MRKIPQAICPSCHPSVSVKVLEALSITSCARGDTICPRPSPPSWAPERLTPPSRLNIAVVSHTEYVPTLTAAAALLINAAARVE